MKSKLINTGFVLAVLGSILGIIFSAMMIWADLEANNFEYAQTGEKNLRALRCPILINGDEESSITVRLKNNRDKVMTPFLRAYVSEEHIALTRQSAHNLTLQPGDITEIIWKIYPEDAVYERFVFFRVFLKDDYPNPTRDGNCGVWVTDIPGLSGQQILGISLSATLLLLIGGNILLILNPIPHGKKKKEIATGLNYLSALILIDLLLAVLGLWVLGLIILIVILVVSFVLLLRSITEESIA